MHLKDFVFVTIFTLYWVWGLTQSTVQSGYVFYDINENGVYDTGDKPLSGISISNGLDVVQSDEEGAYKISMRENGVIFIIKPSGYRSSVNKENIASFYAFLKPEGSPKLQYPGIAKFTISGSLNFPLYRNNDEKKIKVAILGDTQVENMEHIAHVAKLVAEQIIHEEADFVVPLGDLVFDDLNLFDPLKQVLSKIGSPVYYVYGNHDRNYDAMDLQYRDETFKANFGPSYYAFNYGNNSFIVMNDVFPENGTRRFLAKIDADQLAFIANLVQTIPEENSIHLFMHIPLEEISNREALFEILKNHSQVYAYAGHTHTQYFKDFGRTEGWLRDEPLSELVAGAVCGAWWLGDKDLYGVPSAMMGDGTPKGYWILDIDENRRQLTYKVSGSATNTQMHIWTPHDSTGSDSELEDNIIMVNIFAGDESTRVKLKIEGQEWVSMAKTFQPDPFYMQMIKRKEKQEVSGSKMPYYHDKFPISQHVWRFEIPYMLTYGKYKLTVQAKNDKGLEAESNALLTINDN
ncbi:MAG: calcineurin-like phosphoesterase family protein [Saprospiraceae bacterium]|nr:calcineurin-like phosphoesterase family protein [Saprospiraceae bacterium]